MSIITVVLCNPRTITISSLYYQNLQHQQLLKTIIKTELHKKNDVIFNIIILDFLRLVCTSETEIEIDNC